jgi:hypothetical protein
VFSDEFAITGPKNRHLGQLFQNPVAGAHQNSVHDKGRYRQQPESAASEPFQALSLATEIPSRSFTAS